MKKIPISDIQDHMVLAKPIIRSDGSILMTAGVELRSNMASRLKNWGIAVAYVHDDGEGPVSDGRKEKERRLAKLDKTFEKVKNNPNMNFLFEAVRKYVKESVK